MSEGALAILVHGKPLEDIDISGGQEKSVVAVMKVENIYENMVR